VKKTKEQLMHEPLPLFDCIYCVKDSAAVFEMISGTILTKKYTVRTTKPEVGLN
jgi:hypothetical protein